MKIVKDNAAIIDRRNLSQTKILELAGRTCYKSTDKIGEGTDIEFTEKMINNRHHAMLEHGWIHMLINSKFYASEFLKDVDDDFEDVKYLFMTKISDTELILSGSFRVWIDYLTNSEGSLFNALKSCILKDYPFMFDETPNTYTVNGISMIAEDRIVGKIVNAFSDDPDKTKKEIMKHIPHTIIFRCDRGVTHELCRHRPASFAQESTRYCNYSKDKFGKEITVIEPCDLVEKPEMFEVWKETCEAAERGYFKLVELGAVAQEARGVLPTDLKTEIVITCNEKEWQHIINLRYHGTTGAPHPHCKHVMAKAYPLLVKDSEQRLS